MHPDTVNSFAWFTWNYINFGPVATLFQVHVHVVAQTMWLTRASAHSSW